MEWLLDPHAWVALATLTLLEIVLGVDNIIFITILVGRLPAAKRQRARVIGLALAMLTRLALLFSLAWLMTLTAPLFTLIGPFSGKAFSGRDLILIGGGLFLLWKSVHEIHNALEGAGQEPARGSPAGLAAGFTAIVAQIAVIDIVFSLDSVITAIGMVDELGVMVTAIVLAVFVMLFAAKPIGEFVDRHPTLKMLALAFLILIGVALVCDGFGIHVPKGYIYFAMAFAVAVEMLNLRLRARLRGPLRLRKALDEESRD